MDEQVSIIKSKTSLRKILRSLSLSEIEKVQEKFLEVSEKVIEEKKVEHEKSEAHKKEIEKFINELNGKGISSEEIIEAMKDKSSGKKVSVVPPKYRISLDSGETVEWTGRGRTPRAFADAISSGAKMDDFLIQKDDE